jgi:phosphohistidine phosphatase SixA
VPGPSGHDGSVIARLLLCLVLVTGCSGLRAPEPEGPLTGDRLVEALQDGGLVLFLRHTETTADGVDDLRRPGRCEGQRSLTDEGRRQARAIGRAFTALEIPVGRVLASPICRTAETARLAFGRTDTDRVLLPVEGEPAAEQIDGGQALLADEPTDGENTVLVGHISSIRALAGTSPEEGGTVIFRPDGSGGFRLVAEVPPQGWQRLAERY